MADLMANFTSTYYTMKSLEYDVDIAIILLKEIDQIGARL